MRDIFDNVVCAVDDSEAGTLAARIAARVADPEGVLTLVSVENNRIAVHAGWQMAAVASQLANQARDALERGARVAAPDHPAESRLVRGEPLDALLDEVRRRAAGVVVVGTHGYARTTGILLGSVATYMLHEAPCSVVVARAPRNLERWPRKIVVGLDGSAESAVATRVARQLGERLGADVRAVAATDGHVNLDMARRIAADLELLPGKPVDELAVLSGFADLVVVGSRGLKGLKALGSVSERVAHQASSPVLVVRGT